MYSGPNKIESSQDEPSSGLIESGFVAPSDSADDVKCRLVESTIDSIRALKGFIADYDRMKEERDQLMRQLADSLGEVEMLRIQVQHLEVQRDQFSNSLFTLTSQIGILARKAERLIDTHISDGDRWLAALRPGKEGRHQADFKLMANAPAPADPATISQASDPADFSPATPADPSSIHLVPEPADFAPATPADPARITKPDPVGFMAKVLATWPDPSSTHKAAIPTCGTRPPT